MRIGELARESGVGEETIRFYERKGLLAAPARDASSNYRVYGPAHLGALRFIRHCRTLGLGLEEVEVLLHLDSGREDNARQAHGIVSRQLEAVNRRIAELEHVRAHLEALAAECHGHAQGQPCGLIESLRSGHCCEAVREAGWGDPDMISADSSTRWSSLERGAIPRAGSRRG